jgi:high affinity sulfate transporter 1
MLSWLPHYKTSWLPADLIAGLTIMALLVPEGMAYAELAGVGPEAAFYAAPIGLVLYALFGTSRQLVVAVSSAIAVMSASIIGQLGVTNASEFAALTAMLAILAGIIGITAGVLRLGRIARFFSGSVLVGFVSGLALFIMVKQLPKLLGLESGEGNSWQRIIELFGDLADTHGWTLVVGASTVVLMLALEKWFHRIPAALVALVYGIVLVTIFDLHAEGVHVVGEIPSGLAAPQIPDVAWGDVIDLLPGAIAITLVMFAEAVGPARSLAAKHGYRIKEDQELIGLGAANLGAGLFRGFSIGASLSKSAAADAAGGRSQVAGLVAAGSTALVALFLTPLFENLPEAALGAIVIVAVSGMFKVGELKRLYALRRTDFWLAMIALLGVLTFEEVLYGLLVAVLASLLALIIRTRRPQISQLGRLPGTLEFRSLTRHPDGVSHPGLMILRPDEAIFFANAESLREGIRDLVESADRPVQTVLLDLGLSNELDVPGVEMLEDLHSELAALDVELLLADVYDAVRGLMRRSGAMASIGEENIYADVPAAVVAVIEQSQDNLISGDLGAIATRVHELTQIALEHESTLSESQRTRLLAAADKLAGLADPTD